MSGICGVINCTGAPVDIGLLKRMAQAAAYRGPDGINYWVDDNVGFAHLAFNTTPEAIGEEQPLTNHEQGITVAADARVDNRDELISFLTAKGYLGNKTPTDAEIILAMYACWGEESPKHLVGDFSFAIWRAEEQSLTVARDVIGLRQLYYAMVDHSLYFGTTIAMILAALPCPPALNEQLINAFLQNSFSLWICQTVYEGIYRLPPGHTLSFRGGKLSTRLYHVLGGQPGPSYSTDQQYIETFSDLLYEAIRCRLRSTTPVGIVGGGGVDSASIACAIHKMKQEQNNLPTIHLYASVFDDTPWADEREFFAAVESTCEDFASTRILSDRFWALSEIGADHGFPLDEPDIYSTRGLVMEWMRVAAGDGCRVILGGEGANEVLGHAVYYNPAALRGVDLHNWPIELRYFREKSKVGWIELLLRAYISPLIPDRLRSLLRRRLPIGPRPPSWLIRTAQQDVSKCMLADEFFTSRGLAPSALVAHQSVRSPYNLARYSSLDVAAAHTGTEWRYPYLDRRLVDFLLHIPTHLRSWKGRDRIIQRESMKGVLPESVRLRSSKAHIRSLIDRGLTDQERQRIQDLLHDSQSVALGFVDVGELCAAFERYWQSGEESTPLLPALYFEVWLRDSYQVDCL